MASALLLVISPAEALVLFALAPLWAVWMLSALYLVGLTAVAGFSRRPPESRGDESLRFCVLIPAHNEDLNLGHVVRALRTQSYPPSQYSVVVIADNCSDETAIVAREAGAEVMERTNPEQRGKGFALEWALSTLLGDPRRFDAFLIMDADSVLSDNFLREASAALTSGDEAVQGLYEVLNVGDGWRTKLMACALALAHHVRPLGRMTLGLSDGLKGNGMCFSRSVMERIPWSGESITEDIEYTLRLVSAGVRIRYLPNAVVRAQMPTTSGQAASQRARWEGGRYALLKKARVLLLQGVRSRSLVVVDRAVELIMPPFVELMALPIVMSAGCAMWLAAAPQSGGALVALWAWLSVLVSAVVYLAAGLIVGRVPLSTASALLFAPFYALWKFGVYAGLILRRGTGGWRRTERRTL